jgi:hypothetical protein
VTEQEKIKKNKGGNDFVTHSSVFQWPLWQATAFEQQYLFAIRTDYGYESQVSPCRKFECINFQAE